MTPVKFIRAIIGVLILVFLGKTLLLVTPIAVLVETSPWWVYLLLAGIIVSGYLSYKYSKEDKEMEQRWIEQEGEIFMEPIRERRKNKQVINE
ncbi:hypothetical protein BKP37_15670 [Anaerobacillus alkalilacustris]|uniref:Sporulation protein YhaL n=1 Tax=Anaerobacillus alkalilacustris TaxID=393763 RepID=A0A1S2LGM9_9BACI|nr:sporulation YhaL family protein [Anaerobacillus alkalilacustris]OIJ11390.1 hypothetical protein BKP37_15670 [Anaerobacillus alkalilacustris]